mmetsp:Transcript_1734/g.6835  ORF Transcript_1734/g.6835 Transcript_1734/m.6835 type:complete len:320 (+) Transcript_1734:968-1927(+)
MLRSRDVLGGIRPMHWQLRRGRVLQRRALRGRGQLGSSGCTGRHALRGGRSWLRAPARMRSPLEILGPPTPGRVLCPAIPRLRPHVPPRPRGLCSTGCPRPGRALDAPPSATASGGALPFDVLRVGGVRMRPAILLKPPGGEPVDRLDHATGSRLHSRVLLQLGHGDARGPNDLHRTPRGALATPAGGTRRAQRVGHGARTVLAGNDAVEARRHDGVGAPLDGAIATTQILLGAQANLSRALIHTALGARASAHARTAMQGAPRARLAGAQDLGAKRGGVRCLGGSERRGHRLVRAHSGRAHEGRRRTPQVAQALDRRR